jgi:hypothetical protein
MNIPNTSSPRSAIRRAALIALGCAFAVVQIPVLKSAETASLQPLADKAPSLPLTAKFNKVKDAENGPYVLKLKNTSKSAVKVNTKILLTVFFHADAKARTLPEHAIEPGKVFSIPDLSANDKVIITAEGFAPLELTVP